MNQSQYQDGKRHGKVQLVDVKSDAALAELTEALTEDKQPVKYLSILEAKDWSLSQTKAFLEALKTHPEIEQIKIIGGISGDGAVAFAEAMKDLPNLKALELCDSYYASKGATALIKAATHHPSIFILRMENNGIDGEVVPALIDLVEQNPRIADVNMAINNGLQNDDLRPLMEAWQNADAPNLLSLVPCSPPDKRRSTLGKIEIAEEQLTRPDNLSWLAVTELHLMRELETGVAYYLSANNQGQDLDDGLNVIARYHHFLADLPTASEYADLTPETLVKSPEHREDHGLLDNPITWDQLPELAAKFAEQGTPLTLAHLQERDRHGTPHIENAAEMGRLGDIVSILAQNGERISMDMLLDEGGEATDLLNKICEYGDIQPLFTTDNWKNGSTAELRNFVSRMPDHIASLMPSTHSLSTALARQEAPQTRLR